MRALYKFLFGLLAAVGAAIGMYAKGRRTGEKIESSKQLELELSREHARNETIATAAKSKDSVVAMPASDVQQRLRDKYQRD